jgi:hypothetical protein
LASVISRAADRLAAEIKLSNGALATSGDYQRFVEVDGRRYFHVLTPRTGWSAQGISPVTVISERCLVCWKPVDSGDAKGERRSRLASKPRRPPHRDRQDGKYCGTKRPLLTVNCAQLEHGFA